MTYNDNGPYTFKQNVYQITQSGERKRQLLVVTPKASYL